jgi:hypothetical protein
MFSHDLAFLCLFFAVLPFAYALQVLTGIPEAALVGYFPLVAALMVKGIKWQTIQDRFFQHALGALVFFVIAHNAISGLGILLSGNIAIAGRVLCLFVLPVGVFILASNYSDSQQWKLVKVVAITATVVALELLYENVHIWWLQEPTFFQLMNKDYVFSRSGEYLSQLYLPGYRPTGLLEHVHVSTFYVGIGMLAWLAIYLEHGNKLCLLWATICEVVLIVHGIRLALVAGCIAVAVLIFWVRKSQSGNGCRRWKTALWVFVITGISIVLLDPFGTVSKFYLPIFLQGDWDTNRSIPITPLTVIDRSTNTAFELIEFRVRSGWLSLEHFYALFGHGIGASLIGIVGTDDDFFVMQILVQYGLLGAIAFIGLFFAAVVNFWTTFYRSKGSDSLLLVFAFSVIVLLGLSMLHSGVIQRKAIFPVLLWAFAIIYGSSHRVIK